MTRRRFAGNVAANFAGQLWSALLALAVVPFYIRLLGPGGYGLVGFFVSLQLILNVFDLGLSVSATREIARGTTNTAVIIRTLEYVYFGIAAVIAIVLTAGSTWIAQHWINAGSVDASELHLSILLIGVTLAARWPTTLYIGVLRGLERQVLQNAITIAVATLRSGGAVAVLFWISPTISAFFIWQAIVSAAETALFAVMAWHATRRTTQAVAHYDKHLLRSMWRIAAQLSVVSIFAVVLKQVDRVLLVGLVPLEQVGYYTVAVTLSAGLALCATPLSTALLPRLSAQFANHDKNAALTSYKHASRVIALMLTPAALALIFYGESVLRVWTRSDIVAQAAGSVVIVLAAAALLNGMMQVPYALQVAAGKLRIALWTNGTGVVVLVPLTIVMVRALGLLGAGVAWLCFNVIYYFVVSVIIERVVFPLAPKFVLFKATMPPLLCGLAAFAVARMLQSTVGAAWYLSLPAALLIYGGLVLVTGIAHLRPLLMKPTLARG